MNIPPEVIEAGRIVAEWAQANGVTMKPVKTPAEARYLVARELGTQVQYEAWAGPRLRMIYGEQYDAVIDREVERRRLTVAEVINISEQITRKEL